MPAVIHDTAIVEKGAQLGDNVDIGPFSIIGKNVSIGDGTRVGSNVLIEGNTSIGSENTIFNGAAIGAPPQDLKFGGERSFVKIGNENTIREFVTINSAVGEGESTSVGNNCLLMAYVHLAHNCIVRDRVILSNAVNLAGHVTIDDWAIIGGMVPVHQFVSIGTHAFVGGGSRIPKDIPPYFKFAGNPPKVSGLNSVGLERRGFSIETRALLKKAYVFLYRSELNVSQAAEKIKEELDQTDEIKTLIEFICNSRRGLTK
ncbi:MAG: acyl-ACP--UDP-N-acetylglucosamine O-acyltransferase [Candidatus Krumholzibacteriota bacterium]|nr:acyl-ACP--UDP-N-acetylglucosamine O-acyltransferase [Candidatus Krumholzibacteriota bacterium]